MSYKKIDTIVAISTAAGISAIGVIRISGICAKKIIEKMIRKKIKKKIQKAKIFSNTVILDVCLILFFKKPKSFTGEDVVEIHTHGSELILNKLLEEIIRLGARIAEPGEFSFRGYLNGKMDLLQAESINQLINSKINYNNNIIFKNLLGYFSKHLKCIINDLLNLRVDLEAFINFPESVIFDKKFFIKKLKLIEKDFLSLYDKIYFHNFDKKLLKVSIVGNSNVGKSSLFNLLLSSDRSIVSNIPGTTRDFIESTFSLCKSNFLNLIDTAGFNSKSNSFVEKIGILKTFEQIRESFFVIYMIDATTLDKIDSIFNIIKDRLIYKKKFFILYNKIDKTNINDKFFSEDDCCYFYISIKYKKGIDVLLKKLKDVFNIFDNSSYIINERYNTLFLSIKKKFFEVKKIDYKDDMSVFSNNIISLYDEFNSILRNNLDTKLIDKIFSNFCIGK